jgi:hypothetical protein
MYVWCICTYPCTYVRTLIGETCQILMMLCASDFDSHVCVPCSGVFAGQHVPCAAGGVKGACDACHGSCWHYVSSGPCPWSSPSMETPTGQGDRSRVYGHWPACCLQTRTLTAGTKYGWGKYCKLRCSIIKNSTKP